MRDLRPDFLICAAYKWLLGPYSLTYVYADPAYHDGEPIEHGWINRAESEHFAGLVNYREEYQPGARRFEVGERSNFVLLPMAIMALEQILSWGVAEIAATLEQMTGNIARRAADAGLLVAPAGLRAPHIIGLRFPGGIDSTLTRRLLDAQVYVSIRGDSMRVAPYLYNDERDIARLFEVLAGHYAGAA